MISPMTFELPWGSLTVCADWAQAASPIRYLDDDGAEQSTPYQVADAQHRPAVGLRLVLTYLGRSYFADPADDRDEEEILDELVADAEDDDADEEIIDELVGHAALRAEVADCVASAREQGYVGAAADYQMTEADLESITDALGYRPTRKEWAVAGVHLLGDRHVGPPLRVTGTAMRETGGSVGDPERGRWWWSLDGDGDDDEIASGYADSIDQAESAIDAAAVEAGYERCGGSIADGIDFRRAATANRGAR